MTTDIAINGTISSVLPGDVHRVNGTTSSVLPDHLYRVNTHFNVIKNSLSFR
jgi:hypothetical protein